MPVARGGAVTPRSMSRVTYEPGRGSDAQRRGVAGVAGARAVERGPVGQDGALLLHGPAGDGVGEDGRERAHPGAVRLPAIRASGAGARGAAGGAGVHGARERPGHGARVHAGTVLRSGSGIFEC